MTATFVRFYVLTQIKKFIRCNILHPKSINLNELYGKHLSEMNTDEKYFAALLVASFAPPECKILRQEMQSFEEKFELAGFHHFFIPHDSHYRDLVKLIEEANELEEVGKFNECERRLYGTKIAPFRYPFLLAHKDLFDHEIDGVLLSIRHKMQNYFDHEYIEPQDYLHLLDVEKTAKAKHLTRDDLSKKGDLNMMVGANLHGEGIQSRYWGIFDENLHVILENDFEKIRCFLFVVITKTIDHRIEVDQFEDRAEMREYAEKEYVLGVLEKMPC